jgi:putative hydrolases of HD superfamily
MNLKRIANFIFEVGHLKHIKHVGWRLAGVDAPGSVASHVLRAAQIGYVLARLEGNAHPERVCAMVVFHDNGETRVGDINKIANRYVDSDEERAVKEQLAPLEKIGADIFELWNAAEKRDTAEGKIAKDADLLEQAFAGKEYLELGHSSAIEWIINVEKQLQTNSAKKLLETMKQSTSTAWWKGLEKL